MKWLNKGIKDIINKFEYDFYIVHTNQEVFCTCRDFTTKQGDPTCKKCLGTGVKIKIKKARGASQDSSASFRNYGMDEKSLATIYYMDEKYPVEEMDIIVDGKSCLIVSRIESKKGTRKEPIYNQCFAVNMKTDTKIFLKHFNEIIEGS